MTEDLPRTEGSDENEPLGAIEREDKQARDLHEQAAARQSAAATGGSPSFARQMLQLVLIPALIVGGILAAWLLVISLGGQSQSLDKVLKTLNTSGGSVPADQERARTALSLLSIIEDSTDARGGGLSAEDRNTLVSELPKIARLHRGGHEELCWAIMGTLGLLADPTTIPVFKEFLTSPKPQDWFAAVSGLRGWRGDMTLLRPLVPDLLSVLRNAPRPGASAKEDEPIHSLAALTVSVLGVASDPEDALVREALAREMAASAGGGRDLAWNAGCALAVMGDPRGFAVVQSLLDRQWLAQQPLEAREPNGPRIDAASQRKILTSTINVVVGFDPRLGGFAVRVDAPQVWEMIEELAQSDPDSVVRAAAEAALAARRVGETPQPGR